MPGKLQLRARWLPSVALVASILAMGGSYVSLSAQEQAPDYCAAGAPTVDQQEECASFGLKVQDPPVVSPDDPSTAREVVLDPTSADHCRRLASDAEREAAGCFTRDLPPVDPPQPGQAEAAELLAGLPLSFVANMGQTDPSVRFQVRGDGHSVFFTDEAVVFTGAQRGAGSEHNVEVRMVLDRSTRGAPTGVEALPGKFSFFSGTGSVVGAASFGKVRYENVYPGIDLTYSGTAGQLKREFVVAPGADPSSIRMIYEGATGVTVDGDGGLVIATSGSALTEAAPYVYQEVDGRPQPVASAFRLGADGAVTFAIGEFDESLPLVIDPILQFSTYAGTSGTDQGLEVVRDASGVYIVGQSSVVGFPAGGTSTIFGTQTGTDAVAFKLDASLSTLLYSAILASTGTDIAISASLGPFSAGQLDILGTTSGAAFPVCTGVGTPTGCTGIAFDTTINGGTDYFVARLNATGTGLLGSTFIGTSGTENGVGGIDTYTNGDVWIVGSTSGSLWPFLNPFAGSIQAATAGSTDDVIAALRANHQLLVTSGYFGGNSTDQAFDVEILESTLDFHVSGVTFSSVTLKPVCTGPGTLSNGAINSCIAAGFDTTYNPSGSSGHITRFANTASVRGATLLQGTNSATTQLFAIDVNSASESFVFGNTTDATYPTSAGAFDTTLNGGTDQVLSRLNATLSAISYSTFLGGTGTDLGREIDLDAANQAHVTGITSSANFPTTPGAPDTTLTTSNDATVTKVNSTGTALAYSTYLGGSGNENGLGLTLAGTDTAYVTGLTSAANFPTTPGAFDTTHNLSNDIFVSAITLAAVPDVGQTLTDITPNDPECFSPGDFMLIETTVTNVGDAPAATWSYSALFDPNLIGQAGTCNRPDCQVSTTGVTAGGPIVLGVGESFSFRYQVRVRGGLRAGPELCIDDQLLSLISAAGAVGSVTLPPLCFTLNCPNVVTPNDGLSGQVHLPILNFQGQNDACRSWLEVQNVGDDFSKAALVVWGEPGFCPPQCAGPLKVECSGLLKPGSTWNFMSPTQVPNGSKSGILFSFTAVQLSDIGVDLGFDDIVADVLCETLFFGVVGDCDDYRRFKKAYNEGLEFAGIPLDRAIGSPLAVEVLRHCPGDQTPGAEVSSKYAGIAGTDLGQYDPVFGGYAYYVPLLYAQSSDYNSVMYIQNGGLECSSVEIWFKAQDDCLRARICEIFTLAPGETYQFDANDCVGPDFQGNAWLRSSQPMGIAVDIFGRDVLMTYVGVPTELNYTFDPHDALFSLGNQVAYGPLIYSEYQGWDSGVQVQNMSSATAAKVKLYFLDRSGDVITTLVDWICPRGSQTFFLPVVADLPGSWVGSLRVESQEWFSPGDPLVAPPNITGIAMLTKYIDAARSETTEAIAYNLLTEQRAYDWQIGFAGGGLDSGIGLIAIPSVLKDLDNTGVTAELAIANLVPKPGFTDFAVYVYDQNGLVDYVCQKLNEKQVEYISFESWGYLNPGFKGSAIISAVFWEHDVFADDGFFLRNLVGLAAVVVERTGTRLGENIPGDEAAGTAGIPFRESDAEDQEFFFDFEGPVTPLCPGIGFRPPPGEGPQFICPPPLIEATMGDPDPSWDDTDTWVVAGRINRNGVISQCTPAKVCPGPFASAAVNYDAYYFDNPEGIETCVTVGLNTGGCGTDVHAMAFTGEFPAGLPFTCDPAPGVTYIGDVGSSLTQSFSFVIPEGVERWTLLFHNNFAVNACTYSATISGFACQQN